LGSLFSRLDLLSKAFLELGPSQLWLYGLYRLGLRTGYFRWKTSSIETLPDVDANQYSLKPVVPLPTNQDLMRILGETGYNEILKQADEIVMGQVRLYGGEPQSLQLTPPQPLKHWTVYELRDSTDSEMDVKDVWEPARFGWAIALGRAYTLSGDEAYADAFWKYLLEFLNANPPYRGLNWVSGQEVALRLIALVFTARMFTDSPHSKPERWKQLGWSIACHARRIPPTLLYAQAQNNNHLLSEAAGLFTASLALPKHPDSAHWRSIGWHWFHQALQSQIEQDGTYIQHSTNYQRLMLQLALWMNALARAHDIAIPLATQAKLQAATRWLVALLDPTSGGVPNLGPNDGAYILPLTICPFEDYRPVLQAAAQAFLGTSATISGRWDEMGTWLVGSTEVLDQPASSAHRDRSPDSVGPLVLENKTSDSWAYLRAVRYTSRPGHADQLHLDLWWRGLNIAQDAGTYLYNALEPWDNALARTPVHNTLTVNDRDQMLRAGRFLWLDWADSKVLRRDQNVSEGYTRLVVEHNGYRSLGITHRRSVVAQKEGDWLIEDEVIFSDPKLASRHMPLPVRLHWLMPDWPWQIDQNDDLVAIELESQHGRIQLSIQLENGGQSKTQITPCIVRAGEKLYGSGELHPTWGWVSPAYGRKTPALSCSVRTITSGPIKLVSMWQFP